MAEDSIFTKIIKGEIPCEKIYEDDKTIAFLDIFPLLPGHVLVVPKKQVDHFDDLPDEDYQALFATVQKVSKRVKEVLGVKRATIQVLGFDVPHAHVHVMPANSGHEVMEAMGERAKNGPPDTVDHAALAEMAKKLAF